jgi:hypothetical protein
MISTKFFAKFFVSDVSDYTMISTKFFAKFFVRDVSDELISSSPSSVSVVFS